VKTKPGIAQRLPRGQNRGKQLAQTALNVTKTLSREEKKEDQNRQGFRTWL
jgi:hypothetical protein